MLEVALFVVSCRLVTEMATGLGEGIPSGAIKSTFPGPLNRIGWHGLDPVTQICPVAGLPPAIPFTVHVAVPFAVPVIWSESVCRSPMATNEVEGFRARAIEEISVTVTLAEEPGLALLRARTVTMPPAGRNCGAVYVVLFGEICEFKMEPTVPFPPTNPFTSHVTVVSSAPVTTA